jgi:hypothetical protein
VFRECQRPLVLALALEKGKKAMKTVFDPIGWDKMLEENQGKPLEDQINHILNFGYDTNTQLMQDAIMKAIRGVETQTVTVTTVYRSLTPDGGLWTESRNPDEIIEQMHGRTDLTLQRLFIYDTVTASGWKPWDPNSND